MTLDGGSTSPQDWKHARVPTALAAGWTVVVACLPAVAGTWLALVVTVALLVVVFASAASVLLRRRRLPLLPALVLPILFGLLSYQCYAAVGAHHYRFDGTPGVADWARFIAAHVLRAADLVDLFDEYGIRLQLIRHNSVLSGVILVCLHLCFDVFLLGYAAVIASNLAARWRRRVGEARVARRRKLLKRLVRAGCVGALGAYVAFAAWQGWRLRDWFLWPLDNALRTVDLGDAFQIFHWRLHGVEPGIALATLAVVFRLFVGLALAGGIAYVRMTELRGVGLRSDQLIDALGHDDRWVRMQAAEALGDLGPTAADAAPALVRAAADEDGEVRNSAAAALGSIGASATIPALSAALDAVHGDTPTRAHLARALGHVGPAAIPTLVSLLRTGCGVHVTPAMIESFGRIGGAAVPALADVLAARDEDTTREVRLNAVRILSKIGPDGASVLTASLTDPHPDVRRGAAAALGELRAMDAAPALTALLTHDHDPDVRLYAAAALRKLGAADAAPALLKALREDPQVNMRATAAGALGACGAANPDEVVPALAAALEDERSVMGAALGALSTFGAAAAPAAPALANCLLTAAGDQDRYRAADLLGRIGGAPFSVSVRALAKALGDDGSNLVRETAARSLGRIGTDAAAEAGRALAQALHDRSDLVRRAAADVLVRLGAAGAAVVPELIEALGGDTEEGRQDARRALVAVGAAAAAPLITALRDPDSSLRRAGAAACLGDIGPGAGAPAAHDDVEAALTGALATDPDASVRLRAASALGQVGARSAEAVAALADALSHVNDVVRNNAAAALRSLGPAAHAAVPALIAALADPEWGVRTHAADALGAIGPLAAPAAAALCDLLRRDGDESVGSTAIDALGAIGPAAAAQPGVLAAVGAALGGGSVVVRRSAARALGAFGAAATSFEFDLTSARSDEDAVVQSEAFEALQRIAKASSR